MGSVETDAVEARLVTEMKQACLDLAIAAGEMFDLIDRHGLEAAWEGPAVLRRMMRAHNTVVDHIRRRAMSRLFAVGVSPETLARTVAGRGGRDGR